MPTTSQGWDKLKADRDPATWAITATSQGAQEQEGNSVDSATIIYANFIILELGGYRSTEQRNELRITTGT